VDSSYRGLTVDGVPDPRVEAFDTGTKGHDSATPVWMVTKYGNGAEPSIRKLPVPVATWREAHLIIAEAEGGQEAVDRINVLRNHWDLPLFNSSDLDEIHNQIIEERKRELYLEGHHLWDLRRFNLPQTPPPGAPYRQGGIYGEVRCFPLPAVERNNNPNLRSTGTRPPAGRERYGAGRAGRYSARSAPRSARPRLSQFPGANVPPVGSGSESRPASRHQPAQPLLDNRARDAL